MLEPKTKQNLIDDLVRLAGGDIDLVRDAIRSSRTRPDEPADLEQIVRYIEQHRAPQPAVA